VKHVAGMSSNLRLAGQPLNAPHDIEQEAEPPPLHLARSESAPPSQTTPMQELRATLQKPSEMVVLSFFPV